MRTPGPRLTTASLLVLAAALTLATRLAPAENPRTGGSGGDTPAIAYERTLLIQLGVRDLDRAVAFYTDTLGFTLESRNDDLKWARIDPGIPDVTIGLGEKPDAAPGPSISMNFGVRDVDAARATLEARGVTFLGPTIEVPGVVRLADLKDPDGHRIRLATDIDPTEP